MVSRRKRDRQNCSKINCTTKTKKSLNFTPSQPNLEILPHIKEKNQE